jgi:hypothetical protein
VLFWHLMAVSWLSILRISFLAQFLEDRFEKFAFLSM